MHLKKTKKNGRVYLSVVQNYREGGRTRTKTVETIGYADAFAGRYPDPIAHFQSYVETLNEQQRVRKAPVSLTFPHNATIDPHHIATARWGSAIALAYLDALGVHSYFKARAGRSGINSDAGRIFEMLASERMMHVTSKRESWQRRNSFPRSCDFSLADVYEALPCFARHEQHMVRHLSRVYERIRGPYRTSTAFLVMAPFTTVDTSDLDSAESMEPSRGGARHDGPNAQSQEKAPAREAGEADRSPNDAHDKGAIGVGVVLDEDGMPMDYRIMAANPTPEEVMDIAASIKSDHGASRVIAVAGRTPHADAIMDALLEAGDGFVFYRPVHDALPELQSWVTDEQGYTTTLSGSYKVKSRTTHRVKELVLWGRDYALQARKERTRSQSAASQTELAAQNASDELSANERTGQQPARHAQRERPSETPGSPPLLDGYICIATSETKLSSGAIFHIYRELWRLIEPFQIMESDFSPSPYPIAHADHLRAHFLICYTAFFAMRLLRSDLGWTYNAAQVADALLHMEGSYLLENWFVFSYRDEVTDAIEQAAGVDAALRLRTAAAIRRDINHAREHIEEKGRTQEPR